MQANLTYHTPTVESISELVHAFYADVRQDALLGPVFDEALNGQWDEHLHRLVDFWSTVLLGSRSFKGNVLGKHMQLQGITPAHFAAWVRLWNEQTAQLVVRKAFSGKPVQVVAGQVCQHTAFVLAIGHLHRHQALQRGRVQTRNVHAFSPLPA